MPFSAKLSLRRLTAEPLSEALCLARGFVVGVLIDVGLTALLLLLAFLLLLLLLPCMVELAPLRTAVSRGAIGPCVCGSYGRVSMLGAIGRSN